MQEWILMLVFLSGPSGILGEYETMYDCFAAREKVVEALGDPPRQYQAVCIHNILYVTGGN